MGAVFKDFQPRSLKPQKQCKSVTFLATVRCQDIRLSYSTLKLSDNQPNSTGLAVVKLLKLYTFKQELAGKSPVLAQGAFIVHLAPRHITREEIQGRFLFALERYIYQFCIGKWNISRQKFHVRKTFLKIIHDFFPAVQLLIHYITIPNLDRNRTKGSSFRQLFPQRTFPVYPSPAGILKWYCPIDFTIRSLSMSRVRC